MSTRSRRKADSPKRNIPAGLILVGLGILLAIVGAFFAMRSGSQVLGNPSLAVDREQIDFGDVKLNQTVTATFTLTNTGTGTLKFTRQPEIEVREGC